MPGVKRSTTKNANKRSMFAVPDEPKPKQSQPRSRRPSASHTSRPSTSSSRSRPSGRSRSSSTSRPNNTQTEPSPPQNVQTSSSHIATTLSSEVTHLPTHMPVAPPLPPSPTHSPPASPLDTTPLSPQIPTLDMSSVPAPPLGAPLGPSSPHHFPPSPSSRLGPCICHLDNPHHVGACRCNGVTYRWPRHRTTSSSSSNSYSPRSVGVGSVAGAPGAPPPTFVSPRHDTSSSSASHSSSHASSSGSSSALLAPPEDVPPLDGRSCDPLACPPDDERKSFDYDPTMSPPSPYQQPATCSSSTQTQPQPPVSAADFFSTLALPVPEDFKVERRHLTRQWRRFDRDVGQYLLHANTAVMERLVKFNREWGFEEFDDEIYYPRTQQLVFSKPTDSKLPFCKILCSGQVLGTYLPSEHAFVWSWADDGFPVQTVAAARFLYNYAQREGSHEHHRLFTLPLVDCSDELANLLCTAACELLGYDGVFRLTTERRGQLFVAFDVRMKERRALRPE